MALDGISTNIQITCSESGRAFGGSSFWMINNNIYGLLHVPKEFTACTQVICAPENLFIPLVLREMNETRFECVHINYQNSTNFLGQLTELTVITSPLACKFISIIIHTVQFWGRAISKNMPYISSTHVYQTLLLCV